MSATYGIWAFGGLWGLQRDDFGGRDGVEGAGASFRDIYGLG